MEVNREHPGHPGAKGTGSKAAETEYDRRSNRLLGVQRRDGAPAEDAEGLPGRHHGLPVFEHLRETNEKNGIVFGDMILEEAGILIRRQCQELEERTGKRTAALRLNQDEFALWLEGLSRKEAERFGRKLWERAGANFDGELFGVHMRIGMACGSKANDGEKLIRMAKLALTVRVSDISRPYCFYEDIPKISQAQLPVLSAREINTFGYGEEVSLVSIALNLFGKGADFPAQMTLMLRKIGRFYEASGVLVSVLRADFNSNYLEYQWQRDQKLAEENVRRYSEKEKESFFLWLGQSEVRYFTKEDSKGQIIQCFLNISGGQQGVVLPMYDSGSYMDVFEQDIVESEKKIIVSSPEITEDKVDRFLCLVKARQEAGCKVMVITTEPQNIAYGSPEFCQRLIDTMRESGIHVIIKENVEEHFSVLDDELVWHGGMNLLGKEDVWDNLMRIRSAQIAAELLEIALKDETEE